jgi:hypothetical protein
MTGGLLLFFRNVRPPRGAGAFGKPATAVKNGETARKSLKTNISVK